MKKRLFALASALIMVFGMTVTAYAADSADAKAAAEKYTSSVLNDMARKTEVSSSADGVKIQAATTDVAVSAVLEAKKTYGDKYNVAVVVDLIVPDGTAPGASFTLKNAEIKAGDAVVILHQKKDGTWEYITKTAVEDGKVSFKLDSYSPLAILIDKTNRITDPAKTVTTATNNAVKTVDTSKAPKTGESLPIAGVICVLSLAAACAFFRKTMVRE